MDIFKIAAWEIGFFSKLPEAGVGGGPYLPFSSLKSILLILET